MANAEGVAGPSRVPLKFGAFFFDYDLDGRLDFLTCNGHLDPNINKLQTGQKYQQPAQLFWSKKSNGFEPVTARRPVPICSNHSSAAACAYADLDGDGDLDVILIGNGGPAGHAAQRQQTRPSLDSLQAGRRWRPLQPQRHRRAASSWRRAASSNAARSPPRAAISVKANWWRRSVWAKSSAFDRLTILWPGKDGSKTVLDKADLAAMGIDQQHTIKQEVK